MDERTLIANTRIGTIPSLDRSFEISFELKLTSIQSKWQSVLRLTTTDKDVGVGSRIVAVKVNSQGKVLIAADIDGVANVHRYSASSIPLNQWNRIKITQRLQPDSTYSFEATLNDLAFFSKAEISDPQIWNNVDIYAADAFYSPATAKIKNLQVFRINSIPGLIYYPYTL